MISLSVKSLGQYQGLSNLDNKYGFNIFKLEEPLIKYKNLCKYVGDEYENNVKRYEYTGSPIKGVFGYYTPRNVYLYFYKDKLKEIEIIFGYLTQENRDHIYTELIKLYEFPQKVGRADEHFDFFYAWLSDKTYLYYKKRAQRNGNPSETSINIISFKLVMEIQNDKF